MVSKSVEWAASAWKRHHLTPPVDLHKVRRSIKLYLRYEEMEDECSHIVSTPRRWYAVINKHHSEERQRFSLAHEIGEYLLVKHSERTGCKLIKEDANRERFCDRFAVALLMPESEVRRVAKECYHGRGNDKTAVLAHKFGVSETAMKMRLRELNLHSRRNDAHEHLRPVYR